MTDPVATPKKVSISATSIGDRAADSDLLGFRPYVIAIAQFLTEEDTKPPLTLSVEGEWGSGKSSFMKLLRAEIEATEKRKADGLRNEIKNLRRERRTSALSWISSPFAKSEPRQPVQDSKNESLKEKIEELKRLNSKFVEFNAWRHDKAEALWAAFALEFLQQISTPKTFFEIATLNGFKHLNLSRKRFNWREKWLDGIRLIALSAFFIILAIFLLGISVTKFGDIAKLS